jgi:pimeloyl-ACP methyl ester carboxylesterase
MDSLHRTVRNGAVELHTSAHGDGPVILCVHGWPELAHSWRHQVRHFAGRGWRVVTMDERGYGESSRPEPVEAYTLRELCADVAAVAGAWSEEPVILFGHDWGAPIVHHTALLHRERVRAVAGLSVPYAPPGEQSFVELAAQLYAGRFFYQLYFQRPGVAEAELEADVRGALRRIYYSLSGDAPLDDWIRERPATDTLLQGLVDPDPFPSWMTPEDLDVYVRAFEAGGFRGPIHRYRAQALDVPQLAAYRGRTLAQPTCFIGGERDPIRHFVPGVEDLYADPGAALDDFRGSTIVPGAGHWVQQEAPEAVNAALERFLAGIDA